MAIRVIRTEEDPVLRKISKPVKEVTPKIITLIDDMLDTMYEAMGVGLAAPQVGILKRIVVIDVGEGPIVLINPEILETSGEQTGDEGCLSVPGMAGQVTRPNYVKVKAMDEDMNEVIYEGDDRPVIAYSIPLILSDGTVYGVVGVEMMTSYIQELIPYEELQNSGTGTYLLAETADTLSDSEISVNVINPSSRSNRWLSIPDEEIKMTRTEKNIYEAEIWKDNYIASVYPLTLYNKNAPFSDEQWLLVGIVQDKNLYAFTNHVMLLVKLTIFATLLFGLLSSFIVSRRLAKPVASLSDEVEAAQ